MKTILALVLLAIVACGKNSSTGPNGIDPTVLITNGTATDTLYFTWRDGQGVAGSVTVGPGGTSCTRFTARADSAYFTAHAASYAYTQPWFDPSTRAAWTMKYDPSGHSGPPTGGILVGDVSPVPC